MECANGADVSALSGLIRFFPDDPVSASRLIRLILLLTSISRTHLVEFGLICCRINMPYHHISNPAYFHFLFGVFLRCRPNSLRLKTFLHFLLNKIRRLI